MKNKMNRIFQSIEIILNQIIPINLKSYLAKKYWKNKYNESNSQNSKIIFEHALKPGLSLNKICEFGSNQGENLKYFLDNNNNLDVIGIDINPIVKDLENSYKRYKGIIGDEKKLDKFDNNYFDLSFTLSVLDHVPSKIIALDILKNLIRISKAVILLEPYIKNVEGDVSKKSRYMVKEGLPDERKVFNSFCYLWDYDKYLIENNINFTKSKMPLHRASLGPFYHIYTITKN